MRLVLRTVLVFQVSMVELGYTVAARDDLDLLVIIVHKFVIQFRPARAQGYWAEVGQMKP